MSHARGGELEDSRDIPVLERAVSEPDRPAVAMVINKGHVEVVVSRLFNSSDGSASTPLLTTHGGGYRIGFERLGPA